MDWIPFTESIPGIGVPVLLAGKEDDKRVMAGVLRGIRIDNTSGVRSRDEEKVNKMEWDLFDVIHDNSSLYTRVIDSVGSFTPTKWQPYPKS